MNRQKFHPLHPRLPLPSLLYLLLALVVFCVPSFVLAQESTAEPPAAQTEEVTPAPADDGGDEAPVVTESPIQLTWTALAGLIAIVLSVGVGGGLTGAVVIIRTVKGNDTVKEAIEKLYLSASPDTQRLLRGGATLLNEGGQLADELTDGVLQTAKSVSFYDVTPHKALMALLQGQPVIGPNGWSLEREGYYIRLEHPRIANADTEKHYDFSVAGVAEALTALQRAVPGFALSGLVQSAPN